MIVGNLTYTIKEELNEFFISVFCIELCSLLYVLFFKMKIRRVHSIWITPASPSFSSNNNHASPDLCLCNIDQERRSA